MEHIPEMRRVTLCDQMALLGSISNFHWWDYVKVTSSVRSSAKPTVHFSSHLLYSPEEKENDEGHIIADHAPTSPRNRLMYFIPSCDLHGQTIHLTLCKLLGNDQGDESIFRETEFDPQLKVMPPRKKRKHAARVLRLDRVQLSAQLEVDFNSILSYTNPNRRLYSIFREQLITEGVIQWRLHGDDMDIVVMSDYDSSKGDMLPSSYVHVTSTQSEETDDEYLMKCTCMSYDLLQKAALNQISLPPGQEGFLEQNITCMHCRFFRENLLDCFDVLGERDACLSLIDKKIEDSLQSMDEPVVLLGDVLPHLTTKFSVKGEDQYSVVTISFSQGLCFAKCLQSSCAAHFRNKKKFPKTVSLEKQDQMCPHLKTLFEGIDLVRDLFPDYFQTTDADQDTGGEAVMGEVVNYEDAQIRPKDTPVFNVESGLWSYEAISTHKPRQSHDAELIRYQKSRHKNNM